MLWHKSYIKKAGCTALVALLMSCSVKDGAPQMTYERWDQIPDAIPIAVTPSAYGNPQSYEIAGKTYYVLKSAEGFRQEGIASWYGTKFHGRRTSSGETYDMFAMTAAHKTLPIPVYVEVTNLENDRRIIVKVNDRGPFHDGRIIDLSFAAATKLGVSKTGTAAVKIRVVKARSDAQEAVYSNDGNRLYVQVATYGIEQKAFATVKTLHDLNFSGVRIHVDVKKGETRYRVRIGPLPSKDAAEKLIAQLKDVRYKSAEIIHSM